ncbi:MAG: DUF424 family protein [Candidatus Micrarchaeia archaeon]|jgi:hypothetical protein
MIYFKRYPTEHGYIIAMCDEELIGKVIKEGKIEIDLEKYANFYKGELLKEEEIEISPDEIYSANIIGERSAKIIVKKGLAKEEEIKKVAGIPFVQIFKIDY